jgi:hypothetical protein
MGNTLGRYKNMFRDFTKVDRGQSEPIQFLSERQALMYNPERYNFYQQLWEVLNGPDPTVIDKVLGIESRNRQQYERTQDSVRDLSKSLHAMNRIVDDKYGKETASKGGNGNSSVSPENYQSEGGATWYANKLKEYNDARNRGSYEQQKKVYDEWDNNPVYSSEIEKVSTTDRVVFIGMTFLFRVLTLYLVEWGVNNRMITSFEQSFWYYFIIYISFIILWSMLVNINKEEIVFHLLFYYINTNNSKGMVRIFVHCAIQLLLLPIPFILKEVSAPMYLNFEQRRNVINTLSNYTLFIWILTSAIALRV